MSLRPSYSSAYPGCRGAAQCGDCCAVPRGAAPAAGLHVRGYVAALPVCFVAADAEARGLIAAAVSLESRGGWCYLEHGGVYPYSAVALMESAGLLAAGSLRDGLEHLSLACGACCRVVPGGVYS